LKRLTEPDPLKIDTYGLFLRVVAADKAAIHNTSSQVMKFSIALFDKSDVDIVQYKEEKLYQFLITKTIQ
jgi:hypothetical protein